MRLDHLLSKETSVDERVNRNILWSAMEPGIDSRCLILRAHRTSCRPPGRLHAAALDIPFFGRLIEDLSEVFNELFEAQPCILKTEHRNEANYGCTLERVCDEKATVRKFKE